MSCLMGDRVPCQALVPPRRHRFDGLPADDRRVMSLCPRLPLPRAELLGSFEQVVRVTSNPPHERIPECLLLGECRIGNRLGILGKWASRQLVGLSHAGGSPSQIGAGRGGGWATGPATAVPVAGAGSVPHEMGCRLRSWHTSSLDLVEQYARRRQCAPRLGNWSYGQGGCACLTPTTRLLVEAAHPPHGLDGLVFSFSSEPHSLRSTAVYSLDFSFFRRRLLRYTQPLGFGTLPPRGVNTRPDNLRVSALSSGLRNRVSGPPP